ncbi:MAG: hypothetical protein JWR61_4498 [Ferruginibacter sp.]|jgi:hypothetical protein|uniref:hypothetical protein n=1 Tax=Ferruginibacter sp. TaxID=1940288 RepID=UPI00265B2D46|nr:hypothetical protein [Ferruginibacter sp.]MDB5279543.1 hypothetical protein [Ferruginibacter sp.]
MKSTYLLFTSMLFSTLAFGQTEIKLEDISKHTGDSVKICTTIFGGIFLDRSKGSPTLLNAGGSFPDNPLTLVIWPELRQSFDIKPEEFFKGKPVCIFGKIEIFKNKPQIVVQSKNQIQVQ